jgi:ABC-2 type transport system permease protein
VLALLRRDLAVGRSYRVGLAVDLLFGLLNMAVFYFISRTLRPASGESLAGASSYFAYVAVGVAIVTVIGSTSVLLARNVREEQLTGTLEALAAAPVSAAETALGLAGYPFVGAVARAAIYVVGADLVFGLGLSSPDWLGFLIVLTAALAMIAALGMAMGALVLLVKRAEGLLAMITFALGFLGGAYFPRGRLPGVLEAVSEVTPTRFAFDGARSALIQGHGWGGDVLALLAIGAVGLPLAVAAFAAALELARRRGTLARY